MEITRAMGLTSVDAGVHDPVGQSVSETQRAQSDRALFGKTRFSAKQHGWSLV